MRKGILDIKKWNTWYKLLSVYYEKNGHSNVPARYCVNGKKLGLWVRNQRISILDGKLPEELVGRLELLEFSVGGWYEKYAAFKEIWENDSNKCELPKSKVLKVWISTTKASISNNILHPDKALMIEALNCPFFYEKKSHFDVIWDYKYEILKQYVSEYGNALVPSKYVINGVALGLWGDYIKQRYKAGKLSAEKQNALRELGFVFDTETLRSMLHSNQYQRPKIPTYQPKKFQYEKIWKIKFDELVKFKEEYGHCFVPLSYKVPVVHQNIIVHLGQWLDYQFILKQKNEMKPERLKMLTELGVDFDHLRYGRRKKTRF